MNSVWLYNEEGEKVLVDVDSEAEGKWRAKGFAEAAEPKVKAPVEKTAEPKAQEPELIQEPISDPPMELTDENLIAAVAYCMDPEHPTRLTMKGKPEVKAMEQFLDTDITAKDRDRAQELYIAAQNKG